MSHFLSVLFLATALTLTVCIGVAAWRVSEEKAVEVTGQIPHQTNTWDAPSPAPRTS